MSPLHLPRTHPDPDPRRNHPFQDTNDPGMGAAASGGAFRDANQVNMLGVTAGMVRATRCALAGCGRERHDPIHALDDA
jgi:hypothetical protein